MEHHGSDVNRKPSTVDGLPLFRNGGVGRRDGCVQRTIDFVKQVPSFHCFLAALALLFAALVLGACLASSNKRVVELSAGMEDSRQTLEHQAGQCSEAIAGLDERLSETQYEVAELKRNCTSLEEENGDLMEEIRSLEISNIKLMKLVDKVSRMNYSYYLFLGQKALLFSFQS